MNAHYFMDKGVVKVKIEMVLDADDVLFYAAELPQRDGETARWSRILEEMKSFFSNYYVLESHPK